MLRASKQQRPTWRGPESGAMRRPASTRAGMQGRGQCRASTGSTRSYAYPRMRQSDMPRTIRRRDATSPVGVRHLLASSRRRCLARKVSLIEGVIGIACDSRLVLAGGERIGVTVAGDNTRPHTSGSARSGR